MTIKELKELIADLPDNANIVFDSNDNNDKIIGFPVFFGFITNDDVLGPTLVLSSSLFKPCQTLKNCQIFMSLRSWLQNRD